VDHLRDACFGRDAVIEVLLGDVLRAKIELEEGRIAGEPPWSKREVDMDF
jgi:hypothetical protein